MEIQPEQIAEVIIPNLHLVLASLLEECANTQAFYESEISQLIFTINTQRDQIRFLKQQLEERPRQAVTSRNYLESPVLFQNRMALGQKNFVLNNEQLEIVISGQEDVNIEKKGKVLLKRCSGASLKEKGKEIETLLKVRKEFQDNSIGSKQNKGRKKWDWKKESQVTISYIPMNKFQNNQKRWLA